MLGKLIKNEFKATYKMFVMLFCSLVVLTLLTRFCIYIPFDNTVFKIMTVILTVVYVVAMAFMSLLSLVLVIKRFYQNMLRDQGYLSHTLPVKMWQQLVAKMFTYWVWIITSILALCVSLFVFFVGKPKFTENMNTFFKAFNNAISYPKVPLLLVLVTVLVLMQILVNILNFFAALSLGQIFVKHKILGAIVFYFLLNYIMSFVVSGVMLIFPDFTDKINNIDTRITNAANVSQAIEVVANPMIAYFLIMILMEIVLGVIYFAISNYMLSKKLNLE